MGDDGCADALAGDPSTAAKLSAGKASACTQTQSGPAVKLESCMSPACRKRSLPYSAMKRRFVRREWAKQRGHIANRLAKRSSKIGDRATKNVCLPPEKECEREDAKDDCRSLGWGGSNADLTASTVATSEGAYPRSAATSEAGR